MYSVPITTWLCEELLIGFIRSKEPHGQPRRHQSYNNIYTLYIDLMQRGNYQIAQDVASGVDAVWTLTKGAYKGSQYIGGKLKSGYNALRDDTMDFPTIDDPEIPKASIDFSKNKISSKLYNMPYRRSRRYGKRYGRKKRYTGALTAYKKRGHPTRVFHKSANIPNVYSFKRWSDQCRQIGIYDPATSTWGTAVDTQISLIPVVANRPNQMYLIAFRFNSIPSTTDFTALFRYYKLTGVQLRLVFRNNTSEQGTTNMLPIVSYVIAPDLIASNAPTTQQAMREYQQFKQIYVGTNKRVVKLWYVPTLGVNITGQSGGAQLIPTRGGQWISTDNGNINHGSILFNIDNTAGVAYDVDIECKYYFKCRGVQ